MLNIYFRLYIVDCLCKSSKISYGRKVNRFSTTVRVIVDTAQQCTVTLTLVN